MSKVFWAVKYSDDTWITGISPPVGRHGVEGKKRRFLFPTQRDALQVASGIVYPPVKLVKVTRRPKPEPELRVGDEVLVRAKVKMTLVDKGMTRLDINGYEVWNPTDDIVRAAKEKP